MKYILDDRQMSGTADRQELRNALYNSQYDRLYNWHNNLPYRIWNGLIELFKL